jgi:hypothetical protein
MDSIKCTMPDWVVNFPRAVCLARKDSDYRARVLAAKTPAQQQALIEEAKKRFPATSTDVIMLEAEMTD